MKDGFIKALAWSGLLPVLAVFMQSLALGMILIHNNPSFAETYRAQLYAGARPVGLTNEASFFVYQLFFSTIAVYYGWKGNLFSRRLFYILTSMYIVAVILSLSRTGLLVFALFYLMVWFRETGKVFTFAGFIKILKYIPLVIVALFAASKLTIGGFNLGQRVLSAFQSEADMSTIERYGSAKALLQLFLDKCLIFGTGIYNYQYYIKNYLPSEMNVFYYPKGTAPASFNFVLQLMIEFGLVMFLLFSYLMRRNVFSIGNDRFYKDWFLFVFVYSFLFQTLNFAVPFLIFFYPAKKAISTFVAAHKLDSK